MHLTDPVTILFFVLGLAFGSFGSVLIERLPENRNIGGRSKCPKCGRQINIPDLIPVISFLFLGGKCRSCSGKISIRYPLAEISSALLFVVAIYLAPSYLPVAALMGVILWLLLIISVIDAKTQGIPDVLNVPFVILTILYAIITGPFPVIPPLIAAGFFFAQWKLSGGKWVGSGDIILAAGLGFLLGGISDVVLMLGISYIAGAIVAVLLLVMKKKRKKNHLAFGPFLAAGTLVVLLWGEDILSVLI